MPWGVILRGAALLYLGWNLKEDVSGDAAEPGVIGQAAAVAKLGVLGLAAYGGYRLWKG